VCAGRCRKQLTKLSHIGWLSPRIIEAIVTSTQRKAINRTMLLDSTPPVDRAEIARVSCEKSTSLAHKPISRATNAAELRSSKEPRRPKAKISYLG
jgi:hypothetical protein